MALEKIAASSLQATVCLPEYENLTGAEEATIRATRFYGSFRKGEADNGDSFLIAVVETLRRYPPDVVQRVMHPLDGPFNAFSWKYPFPPQATDVHKACEEIMATRKRIAEREARERRQLEEAKNQAEWLRARRSTGVIDRYLAGRQNHRPQEPRKPAHEIAARFAQLRAEYGEKVTLTPEAEAILRAEEAA